ncbi:hypothetical protein [Janthinobacterium psychrotolerans]|uniref:PIN domain-containing protein n=1 Tax=Janthinobacterium psychrotolerans TaxID=1747903 RepID=A0A1A7C2C2_9BURK|nr:hypothetical protein [Janthinobacterium psychrotolerans]OBV39164.1 hypothetical protein ASR47_1008226 [Janthinobacterium psychrotolerans]
MSGYLLDADVVHAARKGAKAPPGVRSWFERVAPEERYLPVQVVAQWHAGIRRLWLRGASMEALAMESWLEVVLRDYAARLLEFDLDCAVVWSRLPQHGSAIDGQIAAMGIAHGLTVVSGRLDRYAATGLRLENPFA